MNTMASTLSAESITITQRQPERGLQGREGLDDARSWRSSSPPAQVAAARPRTAVGKTSPCSNQPVPPTPIANEAMKIENPTMTTTIFGVPVSQATPTAATSMNTAMPA